MVHSSPRPCFDSAPTWKIVLTRNGRNGRNYIYVCWVTAFKTSFPSIYSSICLYPLLPLSIVLQLPPFLYLWWKFSRRWFSWKVVFNYGPGGFFHVCPAYFTLLNDISFVMLRYSNGVLRPLGLLFHSFVWSSLHGAKVFLWIFLLKTPNLKFFVFSRGYISDPYSTPGRINVTYIWNFKYFDVAFITFFESSINLHLYAILIG